MRRLRLLLTLFALGAVAPAAAIAVGCLMHVADLQPPPGSDGGGDAPDGCTPTEVVSLGEVAGNAVRNIAVGATNVFWTTDVAVSTVPKNGGMVQSFKVGADNRGIAADGSGGAYWVDHAGGASLAGRLYYLPADGSGPKQILDQLTGPVAVATDAMRVYYLLDDGSVWSLALEALGPAQNVAAAAAIGEQGSALVIDGDDVLYALSKPGNCPAAAAIMRVKTDGGNPCTVATTQEALTLAAGSGLVFWESHCPREIDVAPIACGQSLTKAYADSTGPVTYADARLFWGDQSSPLLRWKCSQADAATAPSSLPIDATIPAGVGAIATDEDFIYVAVYRQIFRITKPCGVCDAG